MKILYILLIMLMFSCANQELSTNEPLSLGAQIRQARLSVKMSHKEFSSKVGISLELYLLMEDDKLSPMPKDIKVIEALTNTKLKTQ